MPSGVITLTTDFGHQGPFVGRDEGGHPHALSDRRASSTSRIEILVHWPAEAGFWLARAYQYFPPGTVHVAVVDPGVGTARNIIAVRAAGHVFLAPDNGLLAPVVARLREALIVKLSAAHARGARRSSARARPSTAATSSPRWRRNSPPGAAVRGPRGDGGHPGAGVGGGARRWTPAASPAMVITQDHFGNLITNIDHGLIERFRLPLVHAGNHSFPAAAHLRGEPARGVSGAGELLRRGGDRPRGGQRRRGPGPEPRGPGGGARPHRSALRWPAAPAAASGSPRGARDWGLRRRGRKATNG